MRKMRLSKREITDMNTIREILEECDVVRLGLRDNEGMFIVPVNYGYDLEIYEDRTELKLYIHAQEREGRPMRSRLILLRRSRWTVAIRSLQEIIPAAIRMHTGVSWAAEPSRSWRQTMINDMRLKN